MYGYLLGMSSLMQHRYYLGPGKHHELLSSPTSTSEDDRNSSEKERQTGQEKGTQPIEIDVKSQDGYN